MKKLVFFKQKDVFKFSLILALVALFQTVGIKAFAQSDEPLTATVVSSGCVSALVDPALYTPSANPGGPGCGNNPTGTGVQQPDAWFALLVPSSGELSLSPTGTVDAAMAAYTYDAAAGTFSLLDCDDDTGPGLMPLITLTALAPGEIVYVQLWAYGGGAIDFSFCFVECANPTSYYADADGDGDGAGTATTSCTPIDGWSLTGADCDDTNNAISSLAVEVCDDLIDNNCDTQVDEGCTTDADGDGSVDALDCQPFNSSIYPGAAEVCNTIDEDCDGVADNGLPSTTYYLDADLDGYGQEIGENFCFNPNLPEVCGYTFNLTDTFGDGWNGNQMQAVDPSGVAPSAIIGLTFTTGTGTQEIAVLNNGFLYDLSWTTVGLYTAEVGFDLIAPDGTVIFNLPPASGALAGTLLTSFNVSCPSLGNYVLIAGDCDDTNPVINTAAGNCTTVVDNDADGYGSDVDCDDNNAAINPAANEVCDGIDNNCNIEIDEFVSTEYYADLDGDGFGDVNNTIFDCSLPAGFVTNFDDCDDANITYFDNDGDGDGAGVIDACGVISNADCDDFNPNVSSLSIEICENGIDDDCVGGDDVCVGIDADADGFIATVDCDDNNAGINPGATELCGDGIDQNCSGIADEGCSASDNDGDGFDALTDCNDNCATIYPGAPCNDGNAETVDETIQVDCTCGGGTTIVSCLGPQSISFEPAPTAGTWPIGTNVTICYTLDYGQNSGDWLDGMAISLGTGWSLATPLTAPLECNGGPGDWIWQESIAPTGGSAYPAGQGYYYDYTIDGDGGNDFGDAGSCNFSMCFTATTVAAVDLLVTVASGGDSQFGSYNSTAGCPIEPFTVDPVNLPACSVEFPFCATPSTCDPITNQYTLVQAQNNYINTTLAPGTGTMDLYLDGVIVQTWNAPFNSVTAINVDSLDSDGATHTLMSMFSANPGCMGTTTFVAPAFCAGQDDDADGYVAANDCNDLDATVNPGAPEICDLQDNNCDGVIDENQDADGDGFTSCNGDCNDADNTIWTGSTCDDGNATTTNDLIQADCTCAGVLGDEPTNAFAADPATGCIDITVDPAAYTISTIVAAPGCAGNTVGSENPDVWILINAPANGELFLSPQGTGDAGMAAYVYDAATNTYTLLGCDDDTGPGFMPQLTLTGLTPGSPIYVQLWAYNAGNTINFNFCSADCTTALAYYPDTDGDTFGDGTATPVLTCTPDAGWVTDNTDCDDASATAFPGGTEVCGDNIDNNCDGTVDEGCTTDNDGDGFVTAEDCNDNDIAINPAALEICDVLDNNCDGTVDEGFDLDGDGYTSCNGDCNDSDNTLWVGAFCNDGNPATGGDQIQADCTCLGYISSEGDEPWTAFTADPTTGCISVSIDPALYTPSPNPGAPGCANNPNFQGVQQSDAWFAIAVPSSGVLLLNPQGSVDAGMAAYTFDPTTGVYGLIACDDDTGPGFMPQITVTTVPAGDTVYVQLWAFGGGLIDFSLCSSECIDPIAYYSDVDGDGFGDNATAVFLCTPDPLLVTDNTDCNDTDAAVNTAATEVCNDLVDNNCDTQVDEGCTTDADNDGDVDAVDCAPFNASINSQATEICNTIDDNCDGLVDNGLAVTTYYLDADGDTYGAATGSDFCFNPNSPDVCNYTFALTDDFGDGWNGNQIQLTSNGGLNVDAIIGLNFIDGNAATETVLLTNGTIYELNWSTTGLYPQEVGMDVLSPIGDTIYNLPIGSGALAGTPLTSFTAACPALGVYVLNGEDCNDTDAAINPGANNCVAVDNDADGFTSDVDCDDSNAAINPNAAESCNGLDDNCDGNIDEGVVLNTYYFDTDLDGYGNALIDTLACAPVAGYVADSTDCEDFNETINPGAQEICLDNIDNNCNGSVDETTGSTWYADTDLDGFGDVATDSVSCEAPVGYVLTSTDCNDTIAAINPDAIELCDNGVDENCDTSDDVCPALDADGDGFDATVDCDDTNSAVNPGATESCNDLDDNCNTQIDEGLAFIDYFTDADLDGYGDVNAVAVTACAAPVGMVDNNEDCNDADSLVSPGAAEICNDGVDNNCNGNGDETTGSVWYADTDSDGFGDLASDSIACETPVGYVLTSTDCNDADAAINTSGTEVCGNGIDEDCSGSDLTCGGIDADGDGYTTPEDCNDNDANINPSVTEFCADAVDNNCNGLINEGCIGTVDADGDGFVVGYDCDDTNPAVNPGAVESCNLLDDDCDGIVDDSTGTVVYYQDADGDLLGNLNAPFSFCTQPANGWVTNADDCDDTSAALFGPGSPCDNGSSSDITDTYQLDCTCQGLLIGCIDPNACNFNPDAMVQDTVNPCVLSSYVVGSIVGDTLVDTYSYHNYSYSGNLDSVSLSWTLNSPGIFIPISNVATTPAVNVYWSEGNNFDPQGEITLVITDTTNGCNAQFEITLNVTFDTTSTGVNEEAAQKVVAWPNPSNGTFAVVVPEDINSDYGVMLYSMTGELIYMNEGMTGKVWNADLNLSSGIYVMKLVGERAQHVIQVVIEN